MPCAVGKLGIKPIRGILGSEQGFNRLIAISQTWSKLYNVNSFVSLGEAAQALGVSIIPLRRWECEGKLVPANRSGSHRRDDLAKWGPERFRAAADVTPVHRATTSKTIGSAKSWYGSALVLAKVGPLRSWPTSGRE